MSSFLREEHISHMHAVTTPKTAHALLVAAGKVQLKQRFRQSLLDSPAIFTSCQAVAREKLLPASIQLRDESEAKPNTMEEGLQQCRRGFSVCCVYDESSSLSTTAGLVISFPPIHRRGSCVPYCRVTCADFLSSMHVLRCTRQ